MTPHRTQRVNGKAASLKGKSPRKHARDWHRQGGFWQGMQDRPW
jgi:hypothetical protein